MTELSATFDGVAITDSIITNPAAIQSIILSSFINKLESAIGDTVTVANPNSGMVATIDSFATMIAQHGKISVNTGERLTATRATTLKELSRHFSDQDYLNMTASPATLEVALVLGANYLKANALPDGAIQKVIIPRTTVFMLGGREFGLYYPIEIKISSSGTFSAAYDETETNPLFSLSSNVVDTYQYRKNGIDMVRLVFTVYQFSRYEYVYNVVPATGFNAPNIKFNDKFYAARVYHRSIDTEKWVEMYTTLADDAHDRSVLTSRIVINDSTVDVVIPYVYFSEGYISNGSEVKVEIYDTLGALDTVISSTDVASSNINFDLNNAGDYSQVLSNQNYIAWLPYNDAAITGGSNGMSFDEAKDAFVHGAFYNRAPITNAEVKTALNKNGFTYVNYVDNVTNRTSFAYKQLSGGSRGPISVINGSVPFIIEDTAAVSSILPFSDLNTYTILPTTMYRYSISGRTFSFVTDSMLEQIAVLGKDDTAALLNAHDTAYTKYPYHLVVYTSDKYPLAKSFDLTPDTPVLKLVRENNLSIFGAQVVLGSLSHLDNGTGGYKLTLAVRLSETMSDIDRSMIYIILTAHDGDGNTAYLRAQYDSTNDTADIYTVSIPTNYYLSQSGQFRTTLQVNGLATIVDVDLSYTWGIRILLDPSMVDAMSTNDAVLLEGVPAEYSTLYGLTYQTVDLTFGKDLSNGLKNSVIRTWSNQTYVTYLENVYATYAEDVYLRDDNGVPVITISNGVPSLELLHRAGDLVLDGNGNPTIQHVAGSYVRDENGQLIVASDRRATYYVDLFGIDSRLYYSQTPADIAYTNALPSLTTSHIDSVVALKNMWLETTDLFFKPMDTIGTATFGIGDGVTISIDRSLSFSLVVYANAAIITNSAKTDAIANTIISTIKSYIASHAVIDTTSGIIPAITNAVGSDIISINNFGINGDSELQTLICMDDTRPIVGATLIVRDDGSYALQDNVIVEFRRPE